MTPGLAYQHQIEHLLDMGEEEMTTERNKSLEEIAASWDGCKYDAVGETLDIGEQLRRQFAALAAAPSPVAQSQEDDLIAELNNRIAGQITGPVYEVVMRAFEEVLSLRPAASPVAQDEPLNLWRAICEEAGAIVDSEGDKYLMLSEEMCIRLGSAIEARAATPAQDKDAQNLQIECNTLRHGLRLANDRIADLMAAQDKQYVEMLRMERDRIRAMYESAIRFYADMARTIAGDDQGMQAQGANE